MATFGQYAPHYLQMAENAPVQAQRMIQMREMMRQQPQRQALLDAQVAQQQHAAEIAPQMSMAKLNEFHNAERARQEQLAIARQAASAKQVGDAWSDPYSLNGATVQRNTRTGEVRQAVPRAPVDTSNKAPPGYRFKPDGNLEPIQGGPKDTTEKTKAMASIAQTKGNIVTNAVDEALGMLGYDAKSNPGTLKKMDEKGWAATGLLGQVLSNVGNTSAYNLDSALDTIRANIGFNELAEMRQASPTGGALGQVAVRELDMLQAVLGSLRIGQDKSKVAENLFKIRQHYTNWLNAVNQARSEGQPVGQSGTQQQGGIKFLGFEGD